MDERADAGDDENHHPRQRIEAEPPGNLEAADGAAAHLERDRRNPLRDRHVERPRVSRQLKELPDRQERHRERRRHRRTGHAARGLAREIPDAGEAVDGRPDPGQQRYQPDVLHLVLSRLVGLVGQVRLVG